MTIISSTVNYDKYFRNWVKDERQTFFKTNPLSKK